MEGEVEDMAVADMGAAVDMEAAVADTEAADTEAAEADTEVADMEAVVAVTKVAEDPDTATIDAMLRPSFDVEEKML